MTTPPEPVRMAVEDDRLVGSLLALATPVKITGRRRLDPTDPADPESAPYAVTVEDGTELPPLFPGTELVVYLAA